MEASPHPCRLRSLLQQTCIRTSLLVRSFSHRRAPFTRRRSLVTVKRFLCCQISMQASAQLLFSALVVLTACGPDAVQEPVSFPLWVAGSGSDRIETSAGVEVILDQADLAFGPLYLCAGSSAGRHCEMARVEWLETTIVDALERTARRAGRLTGVSGPVRSWMYDLGISSSLTTKDPVVRRAAERLGNNSVALRGRLITPRTDIAFTAQIPLEPTENSELGVPLVRKSSNERFEHEVTAEQHNLLVRFDASEWLRAIDFDRLLRPAACGFGREHGCAEDAALSCDSETGEVIERQPCDATQVCVQGFGCTDHVDVAAHGAALRALRHALESDSRPTFEWDSERR